MDSEERLKILRQRRRERTKSESIVEAWRNVSQETELSTKEKLERLIQLTGSRKSPKAPSRRSEPEPRPPFRIFENRFHRTTKYGRVPISSGLSVRGKTLSLFSREPSFGRIDLSSALFLDLETTGLSGGVGVVPFLIGLGFYREDQFRVLQYFLGEPAEEDHLIRELARFLAEMNFQSVVTFNGKAFDLPLLEARFTLHREPFPLQGLPHLDFLFPARTLWGHRRESCRLAALAREVLYAQREEDIPSAEIPLRYFEYLRSGDFSLIEPVLSHNQEDLLSLLGVVVVGASYFVGTTEEKDWMADPLDLFGAAKVLERAGETEKFVLYMNRALEGCLPEGVALQAKKKLAEHFKKKRRWDHAVELWQDMISCRELSCFRELAMYYEHRERNYAKAAALAEQALALASGISRTYEADFAYRLNRLRLKMSRKKEGEGRG